MNGNTDRHSREDIFEALVKGRRKIASYLTVRSESDLRSTEEHRILFGLLQASAQKETDLENDPHADDISMIELIPPSISQTAAVRLHHSANVVTLQDLLSADRSLVSMALAGESELVREFVLIMAPATVAMSYEQYLKSLPKTNRIFSSPRH